MNERRQLLLASSLIMSALIGTPALADTGIAQMDTSPGTGMSTGQPSRAPLKPADSKFVTEAASAGMFEVQASQLAMQRSSDPAVKDFAQHMVDDHSKNAEMLKGVASAKGASVPATLLPDDQKMLDKLDKEKSGKDFDKAYCQVMRTSHSEAVSKYHKAEKAVADNDLRTYISTSLPTLEHHSDMAKALKTSS